MIFNNSAIFTNGSWGTVWFGLTDYRTVYTSSPVGSMRRLGTVGSERWHGVLFRHNNRSFQRRFDHDGQLKKLDNESAYSFRRTFFCLRHDPGLLGGNCFKHGNYVDNTRQHS